MLLTPYLPPPLLRWRLKNHAAVIHQLDRALAKVGIGQLTAQEVKSVRGGSQDGAGSQVGWALACGLLLMFLPKLQLHFWVILPVLIQALTM